MKDLICTLLQASAPSMPQLSNFCRKCGGKIAMMVPPGENEERHVCSDCGYVGLLQSKAGELPGAHHEDISSSGL